MSPSSPMRPASTPCTAPSSARRCTWRWRATSSSSRRREDEMADDSQVTVPSVHRALSARPPLGARDRVIKWASMGVVAALLLGAYFTPWWTFILYAPQYPAGLRLAVSLTGVSGDV